MLTTVLAAVSWQGSLLVIGVAVVLVIFPLTFATRYRKAGPNEALIISGRGRSGVGFRIVKGGGTFIWPIFEQYEVLSLELMTIDVKTPEVYTITGVRVMVDGVAQVKVRGDTESIGTAAEQFLTKSTDEMNRIALQTLEGHLRAILGTMTVEEIYKNRDAFAQRVQEVAASDMANMGLEIVSFTLRDIRDNEGYLDALGVPRTAQVKRDAEIGQAEANRDATIKSAQANQAAMEAKYLADTHVAESERDYEMQRANYQASINERKAEADLAYDLQKYKTGQKVKGEEIQIEIIEKEKRIDVQDREIQRREKELAATIHKPAEAEAFRVKTIADAEKFKRITEAAGAAEAQRQIGLGEADAEKAKGLAEAEVIRAQGESEAEAMQKKADAWRSYNEAAITQLFIDKMPELARAIAEPLSKTERIVIINSGGNGSDGAGASKLTRDVTDIMAQLPEVVEALSGLDLRKVIAKVPGLASDAPKKDGCERKPSG